MRSGTPYLWPASSKSSRPQAMAGTKAIVGHPTKLFLTKWRFYAEKRDYEKQECPAKSFIAKSHS